MNQLTDRAVINWPSFSVGANEVARFNQPSSSSAILNRVTGGDLSAIYGTLEANGRVFLINPNGILFGPNANVNVGALIASTLNVPDAQFMQGGNLEFSGDSRAGVQNFGTIRALEGDIFLIAANVANYGTLQARNGVVGMAAGQSVLLADSAHPRLTVRATSQSIGGTGVLNRGLIEAMQAELIANGGNVYGLAINNEGIIRATGVEERGGRVFLVAQGGNIRSSGEIVATRGAVGGDVILDAGGTEGSSVTVDGTINVSGEERGGFVYVKAANINLGDANIDASGAEPGTVLVSLGPHSVNLAADRNGAFLKWNNGPTATSITDDSGTLQLTHGTALDGGGAVVSTAASDPFVDLLVTSADPSNPYLGFVTFNVDRKGGSIPAGTKILVSFSVLEPNGSTAEVQLVLSLESSTRFSFQATNGELIQSITLNSSDLGYVETSPGVYEPVPGSVPVVNSFKQIANVEIAAGVIIVEKQTIPDGSTDQFDFNVSGGPSNYYDYDFLLSDGQSYTNYVLAGSYTVTETGLPDGWGLSSIAVTGDMDYGSGAPDLANRNILVDLDSGEVIRVTFTNTQGGQIIVQKQTVPDGSTQPFDFTTSYGDPFQLADGQTNTSGYLPPGTYTVEELAEMGWFFDGVTGADSVSGQTATVNLAAGETRTLVFSNTQGGQIVVTKDVLAGDPATLFDFVASYPPGSFQLSDGQSNTSGYLRPGTYTVEELAEMGWFFDGVTGADGVSGQKATVNLAAGETRTLVFSNTQGGQIVVTKDVLAGDSNTLFDFVASYPPGSFQLSDGQSNTSGYLRP
ncbi:MAG TPA: filamentous hemagglutinin N-terminal domain-containing protein, partial [Candidatus Anammoximicrobium sp.]|nr:filamentous hemagglutinin N-terminal domain-containing protein [Candidatus Anammoximicrobium sp.]